MQVVGIGCDIVANARIAYCWQRHGQRFLNRLLTPIEQQIFWQRRGSVDYLATRFSAKEAIAKALGTGFTEILLPKWIEVINADNGQPQASLLAPAHSAVSHLQDYQIHLSISDERTHSIAFALVTANRLGQPEYLLAK